MKKVLMLLALIGVSLGGIASATTWDVNTDMNASIGDNGIWSYGYAEYYDTNDPNKVAYQGLLGNGGGSGGTNNIWLTNVGGAVPHIFVGSLVGVPLGFHGMNGGVKTLGGDVPAVIRWTAPATIVTPTNMSIHGWFQPVNSGVVEAIIVKSVAGDPNQQTFLLRETGITSADGITFSTPCTVAAGDTIDFMISPAGSPANDWTTTTIIITDTPEDPSVTPWDLNTDMDTSVNDNGIWSYGYGDPNATAYAGLIDDSHGPAGDRFIWVETTHGSPHIWKGNAGVPVPTGIHGMNGGVGGEPAIARWTAPAAIVTPISVIVDASFQPVSSGLVDVKIVKSIAGDANQQTILDAKNDVSIAVPFASKTQCTIAAGDTIDCMVGPARDGAGNDWTATSITISEGFLTCVTYLPMDFTEDCYVNLEDFAIFAQSWLDCNDQSNPICE